MDLEEKVFVLLPVHNRRQVTEKFVECLRRQTYRHWDLILVDDGSTDGTAEAGRSMIDSVSVLRGRENGGGPAESINRPAYSVPWTS